MIGRILAPVLSILAQSMPVHASFSTESFPFDVEWTVSSITALSPELQVLVRNRSADTQQFFIRLQSDDWDVKPPCTGAPIGGPPLVRGQYSLKNIRDDHVSMGTIAPGRWNHRIFTPVPRKIGPPCRITFEVGVPQSSRTKIFHAEIPLSVVRSFLPSIDTPNLETLAEVEEDVFHGQLLVRLLITNHSDKEVSVAVRERNISCENPAPQILPSLAADWPVPAGMDSGPGVIKSHGWIGFVQPIGIAALDSAARCHFKLKIATLRGDGWIGTRSMSVPLSPFGRMSVGIEN